MELTEDKIRELQTSTNLRKLPEVIKSICNSPNGLFATLFSDPHSPVSKQLLQNIDNGLHWYNISLEADQWLKAALLECCGVGTKKKEAQLLSLLAEIDAYLQLSFCFGNEAVVQLSENDGKNGTTPDFCVDKDLYIEVYCPDEALNHKQTVSSLSNRINSSSPVSVATAITRPVTGNIDKAKTFSTNKTIERIISAKRENDQTRAGKPNILWLNLTNKLNISIQATLPVCSVSKDHENTVGSFGVWHSFYGKRGSSLFAFEGHSLRFHDNSGTYKQIDHNGLFRDRANLSAVLIQCRDGIVVYQNPWASIPLLKSQLTNLFKVNKFKPEYSWVTFSEPEKLKMRVEDQLDFVNKLYEATSIDESKL